MNVSNPELTYTGIFFLFLLLSGFWVSRSRKPYPAGIFNLHKFIGLGLGIFLIRTVYATNQIASLGREQWTAVVFTVLMFILTVVAGGLLSVFAEGGLKNVESSAGNVVKLVHKLAPYGIILATGWTLYLLLF